ncbi:MAG: NupC/NupG family nucleoside CNT transporter [Culicoidibacterales bacterium]
MNILIMLLCIVVILAVAYALSSNRKAIMLKTVVVGLISQMLLTVFVLKTPIGAKILEMIAMAVNQVAEYGLEGVSFVFGDLSSTMFVFAINVLGLIVFMSALISVLYYLGIVPVMVKYVGGGIAKLLGTSKPETFNAVANTVLGQTESPLLIKPYLDKLTQSELFAVMVSGMGSASASILVGYAMLGIPMEFLLIALFTVPFSTLIMAKIMMPATKEELEQEEEVEIVKSDAKNIFDAIGQGTTNGLYLALNVGASLIAFIGLIAIVNGVLGIFGQDLSSVLGFLFTPLGWLFNIPSEEITVFASLIGTKLSINEFVAFNQMGEQLAQLSPRTIAILATVLCNFANISSIGIMLGGFTALAPNRREDVARLGFKALIAATLSSFLTGAIVGLFF